MKVIVFVILFQGVNCFSQNLFQIKLNNCETKKFCLDCGDQPAGYKKTEFDQMIEKIRPELDIKHIRGSIFFQVLVDSLGNGCVLSHSDKHELKVTRRIVDALNEFKHWTPAYTEGKVEEKTSINLIFIIEDNTIVAYVERVNAEEFFGE